MTSDHPTPAAHPIPVAVLIEHVRDLVEREGAVPSRNRIMAEFHVGAGKARQVLGELTSKPTANPGPIPREPGSAVEPSGSSTAGASSVRPPDRRARSWPLVLLALPAFVAIWSGWVGLGGLTGFGTVHPLPGIADGFTLNTAITLPIGVETYAAYALHVWLGGHTLTAQARRFAKWSALGALALGALGQVAFHIMTAAGMTAAPWQITTLVSCLPVAVLGCGAALRHLVHASDAARDAA